MVSLRRSKAPKHAAEIRGELRPANWGDAGFHERDAPYAVTMLVGPIEAEHGTPVVQHECHVVAEIQCIPEREQVVALFGVVIAVRLSSSSDTCSQYGQSKFASSNAFVRCVLAGGPVMAWILDPGWGHFHARQSARHL